MRKFNLYIILVFLAACNIQKNVVEAPINETQIFIDITTEIIAPTVTPKPKPIIIYDESTQIFPRNNTYKISLGDLDNDGDLDAVFANYKFKNSAVWFNQGDGSFVDSGQKLTELAHGIDMGDLDGDGDLDVVIGSTGFGQNGTDYGTNSKVYINDGNGYFEELLQSWDDTGRDGGTVDLVDFDTDGDLDAFFTYYSTENAVYVNDGLGNFEDIDRSFPPYSYFDDLDNDGDVDIFYKIFGVGYQLGLNDGAGNFIDAWHYEDNNAQFGDIAFADFDNDGDLDAVIPNGDRVSKSSTAYFINNGDATFEKRNSFTSISFFAQPEVGDINNDGYLDVVIANSLMENEIWLNNGNNTFSILTGDPLSEFINVDHSTWSTLGDVNNDGYLDLFIGAFFDNAYLWLNQLSD